jgi:beta-lactam-binding protein with PASTA domain
LSAAHKTFGGRYEVLERVGGGGMAEVYRARDDLLGRVVAVKVLSDRFAHDRSFVERFRREAQSAANLNHPNIVSLYDYGSDNGTYFIVMEFIDGRPLDDVIRSEGALLPERAAEIAADVAQALQRAHAAGLVHRDIKPSNIMITANGETKVTDFGIARAVARDGEQTMTQTGMVIGTAAYLSPEQAQGSPVDARSDVYSLGCVLYEMLTGRAPFGGDTPLSIAYKHVREEATTPSRVNPDVPRSLDAIVMKAMAKNPENRYASAMELKQDLDRYASGQAVEATPLLASDTLVRPRGDETRVMPEPAYEPRRRRGVLWWLVPLLLLVALLGGLAWLVLGGPEDVALVRIPDVVGRDVDRAVEILTGAGFDPTIERRFSARRLNLVLNQDPPAGTRAENGSEVIIEVSRGLRQASVPDVGGRTRGEAEAILEEAKLTLGDVTGEPSDDVPEGRVLTQSPPPGTQVDAGSSVDITVSSGPETVSVPFVEGQSEDEAVAELEGAGLVAQVTREPNSEVAEGVVVSQDPPGGSDAQRGDVVRILVSEGIQETPLPDVTGADIDSARETLEALGLDVAEEPETEPCVQPPGTVCRTDPAPNTPVSEGDDVTLFVQTGGGD